MYYDFTQEKRKKAFFNTILVTAKAVTWRINMRILVVNDDGITSEGIKKLAQLAARFGEVWVVAPDDQCSAMSQKITVRGDMKVKRVDFPVPAVQAYSVGGTPADCVKAALYHLMPERPDIVFSGINYGYNCGYDILYSGTVGAAMEALSAGIPAIAFSKEMNDIYDVVDEYILPITKELLDNMPATSEIWNVNFPGCTLDEVKGIIWDAKPAQMEYYSDHYIREDYEDGSFSLTAAGLPVTDAPENTDIRYVLDRYISIGKIKSHIIK